MASATDNAHTTCDTRSNLATALSDPKRGLHLATVDEGMKTPSVHSALGEPVVETSKETDPSCMDHVMNAYAVRKGSQDMAETVDERYSNVLTTSGSALQVRRYTTARHEK